MATEINIVRGILTLLLMLSFITLVVCLYVKRHKRTFDEAAQLPMQDDSPIQQRQVGNEGRQS